MKSRSRLYLLLAFFLTIICQDALATRQRPDIIRYRGETCELDTHWGYPTPMQVYLSQNPSIENPFENISTGNWRGHIATWEISDDKLYLADIEQDRLSNYSIPDHLKKQENAPTPKEDLYKTLFPNRKAIDGKIYADWFTGYLRVFHKPGTIKYKHFDDGEPYEVITHEEVTLVKVHEGNVVSVTTFPEEEYWEKFKICVDYREIEKDEAQILLDHLDYIDPNKVGYKDPLSIMFSGPACTEDDFSVFLTRYWTRPIKIPLTDFCIVKDADADFSDPGCVIDSDLLIRENKHLLLLEMGASNVPNGPWVKYAGGSVYIVVKIGNLTPKQIKLTEKDTDRIEYSNSFANYHDKSKTIDVDLQFEFSENSPVLISGSVILESKEPTTYQEMVFTRDEIPVYSIKEYLESRHDPKDPYSKSVEETYQEIVENSKK